jgi:hypothetical protein
MKKITASVIFLLISFGSVFSTATITGKISNSLSSEIVLQYFGGLYSIGAKYYIPDDLYETIDKNFAFKFVFETSEDYCCYNLFINGNGCRIYLKDKDSINISFDPANMEETFVASGKESGLTNFFFAYDRFILSYPNDSISNEEVMPFFNMQRNSHLNLLESFKNGKLQSNENIAEKQQIIINKLINGSEFSLAEYKLLENYSNKFISDAIYFTSYDYQISHIDDFITHFNNVDFQDNFIFQDPYMQGLVNDFIRFSCYKDYIETHDSVTIQKAYEYFSIHKFAKAKELLTGEILQKYMADDLYNLLLNGYYENFECLYNQNSTALTNGLYKNVIEEFYNNYLYGLKNKEYKLNLPERLLNDSSLKELLKSIKGHKVYLILWKINEGASYSLSPLSKLHILNALQESSKDKNIRFIDICLADENSRQHWASLIIQYKWKGEHYFISDACEDEFRQLFNCQKRMLYCTSELYFMFEKEGNVIDNGDEIIVNLD